MSKLTNSLWWMCLLSIIVDLGCVFVNIALHNTVLVVYCAILAVTKLFACVLIARRK